MIRTFENVSGKIYDLGGQVLAANSAPTIFHLAREVGSEMVEMDGHKLALIDSRTGLLSFAGKSKRIRPNWSSRYE